MIYGLWLSATGVISNSYRQDVIANTNAADVWANRLDDAGALVAIDDWRRVRDQALDVVEVTVAHTAGDITDPDLVCPGLLEVEHLDLDALTGLVVYRGLDLHRRIPLSSMVWPQRTSGTE